MSEPLIPKNLSLLGFVVKPKTRRLLHIPDSVNWRIYNGSQNTFIRDLFPYHFITFVESQITPTFNLYVAAIEASPLNSYWAVIASHVHNQGRFEARFLNEDDSVYAKLAIG